MNYWDIQTQLVVELKEFGYTFALMERIPIFRVHLELDKLKTRHPELEEKVQRLQDGLGYLLLFRLNGLEPPLQKGANKYEHNGT